MDPNPDLFTQSYTSRTLTTAQARYLLQKILKAPSPNAINIQYDPSEHSFFLVQPPWRVDFNAEADPTRGPVVPQRLWAPQSPTRRQQHVDEGVLTLPLIFVDFDWTVGVSVADAIAGNCPNLRGLRDEVHFGERKTITLRILWPGYQESTSQFQLRHQPNERPITVCDLVGLVGRALDRFFNTAEHEIQLSAHEWRIGRRGGIVKEDVIVIGVVHVSDGTLQVLMQLAHPRLSTQPPGPEWVFA